MGVEMNEECYFHLKPIRESWLRRVMHIDKCQVCNQRRPSECLSIAEGEKHSGAYGYYYFKYCNDKEDCIAEAVKERLDRGWK